VSPPTPGCSQGRAGHAPSASAGGMPPRPALPVAPHGPEPHAPSPARGEPRSCQLPRIWPEPELAVESSAVLAQCSRCESRPRRQPYAKGRSPRPQEFRRVTRRPSPCASVRDPRRPLGCKWSLVLIQSPRPVKPSNLGAKATGSGSSSSCPEEPRGGRGVDFGPRTVGRRALF